MTNMASLIPGYEYDIFISYRQKDNKGDRWVSEFVEALKTELESTFKEEISVYFDINPHDGLLETYDVDASLKDKLKCLVFIPIISRTYCDPKSFAWEHELKAFVEQTSQDQFGLKVKLPNGNVTSRVLPVLIHDLDIADIKECESVLGGFLRGVEFIYKESGFNRPLKADDDEKINLNKTKYRNQITKVALAIKDIITAIEHPGQKVEGILKEVVNVKPEKVKRLIPKTIVASVIVLALFVLGYFLIPTLIKSKGQLEKSIAVLPFINDSPSDSNKYFINGVMEDILSDLQTIKELRPASRTSAEKYRTTTKSIPEIAKELGVNYIVEGSGQKSGNIIRLIVKLFRAYKEGPLWGNTYEQEIHDARDVFRIQSQIAEAIATQLEAAITTKEKKLIEKIPTENLESYEDYLKGRYYMLKFTVNDIDTAMHYFNLAKEIDPEYAPAYAGICEVWQCRQQSGLVSHAEASPKETAAIMKALELDSTNAWVQLSLANIRYCDLWDWKGSESAFKKSIALNPNDGLTHASYSNFLNTLGRPKEAKEQINIAIKLDPMNAFIITFYGIHLFFDRRYDESINTYQDAIKIEAGNPMPMTMGCLGIVLYMKGKYKDALEQFKLCNISDPELVKALEHGYIEGGFKEAMISCNKVAELRFKTSYWSPVDIAQTYAMAGENDKAIKWLQKSFEVHDPVLPGLLLPLYDNLREDPRFQELAKKMNIPYK
jgi:TolB-like protein/Tfp pilus assembly protein PilF